MQYHLRFVLLFATVSGVFPVRNVYSKSISRISFSWFSILTMHSLLLLSGFFAIELYSLDYTVRNLNEDNLTAKGEQFFVPTNIILCLPLKITRVHVRQKYSGGIKKATSGSIFYGNACIAMCLFIRLARRWPKLVTDWKAVEMAMIKFNTPKIGWKVAIMTTVLMTSAFGKTSLNTIGCL